MSIQEARRAAFEKWWDKQNIDPYTKADHWDSWNAALDSVVVELPRYTLPAPKGVQRRCIEAIEAAGIRVEVKNG